MNVALVYDRVNKWGGAERVLLALHELFPDAPLYTLVYDDSKTPWAAVFPIVIPSFLQKIPFLKDKHELLGTFAPIAFESFDFSTYDLVISVTSEAAKGILTGPLTTHICYCLTPTRYLWSGYNEYFSNPLLRFISRPAISYLKKWDRIAAIRPDTLIAISSEVQLRIKNYYGRDSELIFPPVDTKFFNGKNTARDDDYYLVVGRMVPYKKTGLVIDAFNASGLPLVIIGTGSEEKKLHAKAKKNIQFMGAVGDDELMKYYQNAKALIFPQDEDFGLTAVEAQACGTPVIAYKRGGVIDTVIEGKTGVFFESQTIESINKAIEKFEKMSFSATSIQKHATQFSQKRFLQQFASMLSRLHT